MLSTSSAHRYLDVAPSPPHNLPPWQPGMAPPVAGPVFSKAFNALLVVLGVFAMPAPALYRPLRYDCVLVPEQRWAASSSRSICEMRCKSSMQVISALITSCSPEATLATQRGCHLSKGQKAPAEGTIASFNLCRCPAQRSSQSPRRRREGGRLTTCWMTMTTTTD